MIRTFSVTVFLLVFIFLLTPFSTFAQGVDQLLGEPILQEECRANGPLDCDLCDLLILAQRLLNFLVALVVVAATIMFTWAGILYVTAGPNPGNIERAHKIFWNVLIGLVAVLIAWLVIDTVMKTLVPENENNPFRPWETILCTPTEPGAGGTTPSPGVPGSPGAPDTPGPPIIPPGGISDGGEYCVFTALGDSMCSRNLEQCIRGAFISGGICADGVTNEQVGLISGSSVTGCLDCVILDSDIPLKPDNACATQIQNEGDCAVDATLNERLFNLNSSLAGAGVDWRVTEAFAPTVEHVNSCHYNGTCVDANLTETTPTDINTFITSAKNAGLRPVYEVPTATQRGNLIADGVPAEDILVVPGVIPHFSVYRD